MFVFIEMDLNQDFHLGIVEAIEGAPVGLEGEVLVEGTQVVALQFSRIDVAHDVCHERARVADIQWSPALEFEILYEAYLRNPKVDLSYMGSSFLERTLTKGRELYESKINTDQADQTVIQPKDSSSGHLNEAMAHQPIEEVVGQAANHVVG
uniref:Uncharacterized protein n=1 Tax=Cannabis sativa TaxID=3483 RepID=A0A803NKZ5_CANSA